MRPGKHGPPHTVGEYFDRLPPQSRDTLQRLRDTIRQAAPKAEEIISYGIPAFRLHGTLVYYAAFKDHYSFFVGSAAVRKQFARELRPFAGGKGTVRFTRERPLPDRLVKRIVRERLAEDRRKWAQNAASNRGTRKRPR